MADEKDIEAYIDLGSKWGSKVTLKPDGTWKLSNGERVKTFSDMIQLYKREMLVGIASSVVAGLVIYAISKRISA